jgi:predicted DNA-binding ribbon-helix-helix protein
MKLVAKGREEHLSSFIRSACLEVIKRELPSDIPANYFNEIYTNRLSDL